MAIRSQSADSASKPNTNIATSVAVADTTRLAGIVKRLLATSCLGVALVSSTGCSVVTGIRKSFDQSECIDDFMIGYRNKVMAEKAWICNKHRFVKRCNLPEFKEGFLAGYVDVAAGGHGCTPAIAPPAYWGWRYQSPQGQHGVNAWFEGFPHGAKAAEMDGIGHWKSNISPGVSRVAEMQVYAPSESGDQGVANPFYSEPEYQPAPVPEPEPQQLDDFRDGATNPFEDDPPLREQPGNLFDGASQHAPFKYDSQDDQKLELVPHLEPAQNHLEPAQNREATIAAKSADPIDAAPESAAVIIDDIFGTTAPVFSDSDSGELPFSFE